MVDERQAILDLLAELAALPGAPGFEQPVVRRLRERFLALGAEVEVDPLGNLLAWRRGAAGRTVMVAAHSDEIGAVVRAVEPNGFLRIERLGGVVETLLVGRKVWVGGHPGVIGVRPGHLQPPEERRSVPPLRDLYVDLGCESAEEVAALGVGIGSPVTYAGEITPLANPDRVCGKAIDNRLGCALLLRLLEGLTGQDLPATLCGVVAVQEEDGWRGIRTAGFTVDPACAIVVDTVPCGDTPDVDFHRDLPIRLGAGPAIPIVSGGQGKPGYIMQAGMRRLLLELARERRIPHQPTIYAGAASDAVVLHLVRGGIPTGVINIARRYSHSPVEVVDLRDALAALALLRVATLALLEGRGLDFLE